MQVVVLNLVGDDAKVVRLTPVGAPDRLANGRLDGLRTQGPKTGSQRDKDRMGIDVLGPGTMPNEWRLDNALAPRARPLATPRPWGGKTERELLRPTTDRGHSTTIDGHLISG
jgi:hypothetical protein